MFEALTGGRDPAPLYAQFPVNIAPPTDDSPFFFHMLRLRDSSSADAVAPRIGGTQQHPKAVGVARRAAADRARC